MQSLLFGHVNHVVIPIPVDELVVANILLPTESERFLSAFTPLGQVLDKSVMVIATATSGLIQQCIAAQARPSDRLTRSAF